jgi:hypothetical protein
MSYDISKNTSCHEIEVEFSVNNYEQYQNSWLGKMLDIELKKELYWYGLVEDGSQAYEFESFEEFINAEVFGGRSIKEIWNSITLISIDACDVQERLQFYIYS